MDTCTCMGESLCCPPETTTTLLIGCTPRQHKKLKKKKKTPSLETKHAPPVKQDPSEHFAQCFATCEVFQSDWITSTVPDPV